MPHRLVEPGQPLNVAGIAPLMVSLRYQCACTGREVIAINLVMPMDSTEEAFVWSMRQLWRDMHTEIRQHTKE